MHQPPTRSHTAEATSEDPKPNTKTDSLFTLAKPLYPSLSITKHIEVTIPQATFPYPQQYQWPLSTPSYSSYIPLPYTTIKTALHFKVT